MLRNCLSYWFPLIQSTGVRVPETRIVQAPPDIVKIAYLGDGVEESELPDLTQFYAEMRQAIDDIGGTPCFLRTGMTSGKHYWDRTCYLADPAQLRKHVHTLVEFSEIAGIMGLPSNVWVVRKLIKTQTLFTAFHGFPVTREFRVFVEGGKACCVHPYWPKESIKGYAKDDPYWEEKLRIASIIGMEDRMMSMAVQAASNLPGAWSVDVLQDAEGEWWVCDAADAGSSYHWPGCDNEKMWKPQTFCEDVEHAS